MAGNTETRRINVFINSELAGASLKSLKAESRKLYNELANLTPGTDAFIKKTKELKTVERRLGSIKSEIKGTAGAIEGLPGPLGAAVQGAMGLGKAFLALLVNPIIAIIAGISAALMGLYKAFTATDEGATMVEGGMKALGIIMDKLIGFALDVGHFLVKAFQDPKQALIDIGGFIKENLFNHFMGLLELIPNLGKAMVLVFKGEWGAASKIAVDSFAKLYLGVENATDKAKAFGKEIGDAVSAGQDLSKMFDDLSDRTREYSIIAEKNKNTINALILASKDHGKSEKERMDLLNKASKLETETFNKEKGFAEEKLKLIHDENAATIANQKLEGKKLSISDEARQKEVDAINAVETLRGDSIELQQKIANRKSALIDSINADQQKAFEDEQKRVEKENQDQIDKLKQGQENSDFEAAEFQKRDDKIIELTQAREDFLNSIGKNSQDLKFERNEKERLAFIKNLEEERDLTIQNGKDKIQAEIDFKAQKEAIDNEFAKRSTQLGQAQLEWEKKSQEDKLNSILSTTSQTLSDLSEIFADNFEAQKAFAIADTLISTYQSAQKSYLSLAGIPVVGPALGGAAAGISIIAGLARVAKIREQKPPKFAKGGSTFAPGGNVNKPFLAMAGEAGPEWIAPNWMLRHPVYADVIGSLENVRARGYASGGTTSSTPTPAFNASSSLPASPQNQTNELLLTAINQLINKLDKPAVAIISYDQMVSSLDEIDEIKSNAAIGN